MSPSALSLDSALLALYYSVLAALAFYGLHRAYLVWVYHRTLSRAPATPSPPQPWPRVTVQLPLYNERYVARRLIEAVCALDYPRELLSIQVLDDSTDDTRDIVARAVAEQRRAGVDIEHLHRERREGYKAGALAAGLARTEAELIAVFDADFIPPQSFLQQAVPHFADAGVGMVQACWEHLNRRFSLLTRVQAIFLDGHFIIEHAARNRSGCFFNFNGTAGVWRRQAIEQAGGWQHDTLTEDLDLSYRAQLAGWRFVYLPELKTPSELPVDVDGFKSQQHRWAKGSVQTGRKLLAPLLGSRLPWRVKAEAFMHLTNNGCYLLMLLLSVLVFPAMLARRETLSTTLLWIDLPLFVAASGSVLVFYLASQVARGRGWSRQLVFLPALMGLGIGLSVNNARAVLGGLVQRGGVFHRTPKYNIVEATGARSAWRSKRYRAGRSASMLIEGLLALYLGACLVLAVRWEMWFSLPFLYLFFHGYAYVFVLSLLSGQRRVGSGLSPADATG